MNIKKDISSALVVYLVALPLCLGIALASGAPLFSGLIAGIVGGIVIGSLSGSHISVSGPAAGLTVIVLSAIEDLGSYPMFLAAVVLAGLIQFVLGRLKAGVIGYFFPNAVINGMLAAIGLILILKQIPHAIGYDADFEGDMEFVQANSENTLTSLINSLRYISPGALIISSISLLILYVFEKQKAKGANAFFKIIPGALIAVLFGVFANLGFEKFYPRFALSKDHMVKLPIAENASEFFNFFTLPSWPDLTSSTFYLAAFTIAIVASLETLLSIEASDKLDPQKRITPTSRELQVQGVGNMVSGFIGGLPITSVIVRSSANAASGATSKASSIFHGFFLLVTVALIPSYLNLIPFACLAAVLLQVGYKLTNPSKYISSFKRGYAQFIPFVVTLLAIVFTDLLIGIMIGIVVGLIFVLVSNYQKAIILDESEEGVCKITFNKDVSFLNKAVLLSSLESISSGQRLIIDGTQAQFIDNDIKDIIVEYQNSSKEKGIEVILKGVSI